MFPFLVACSSSLHVVCFSAALLSFLPFTFLPFAANHLLLAPSYVTKTWAMCEPFAWPRHQRDNPVIWCGSMSVHLPISIQPNPCKYTVGRDGSSNVLVQVGSLRGAAPGWSSQGAHVQPALISFSLLLVGDHW